MSFKRRGAGGKIGRPPGGGKTSRVCACGGVKAYNSQKCAACYAASRPAPPVCKSCGGPITAEHAKRRKYCNVECMAAYFTSSMDGVLNGNFRGGPKYRYVCVACEAEFRSYSPERKFCSKACMERGDVMRRRAHKDLNHDETVTALRQLGCTVCELHQMGGGMPDLLVGVMPNVWRLVEVKNPAGAYGRSGLSKSQQRFAASVGGAPIDIVRTLDDVAAFVSAIRRGDLSEFGRGPVSKSA